MTVSATAQTNLPLVAEAVEGVSSELQEANQAAYDKVIASINAVEAQYEEAKVAIKAVNPDFDMADWEEIAEQIADAKKGAETALANANEDGEKFSFVFGTEDLEA